MRILAGIVLYNPEIERLRENINAVIDQVAGIVLVNNASENYGDVLKITEQYPHMEIINNSENKGIATALKQIMDFSIKFGYDWTLTLDQDSVCCPGLIEAYSQFFSLKDVGILTCNIVDRNFKVSSGFAEGQRYREVSQCITSASLVNNSAYCKTDGFDEKLFIDSVDFDICINMRIHGFKIYKINFDGILHEVGHGRNVKLMFKDYVSYNHSPFRQYYIARNHKYLVQKYPGEFSKVKEMIREWRAEAIILLYEDQKLSKLRQRWKGLREAKHMGLKR